MTHGWACVTWMDGRSLWIEGPVHTVSTNSTRSIVERWIPLGSSWTSRWRLWRPPSILRVFTQPNTEGANVTLPPVPVARDPEVVETSPETRSSPVPPARGSPHVVQRHHDLGRLHAAVQSAQNWAEIAAWPDLARELRDMRRRVWERICEGRA